MRFCFMNSELLRYLLNRAAQKQATVDTATATPKGTFSNFGLSSEISEFLRNPKEINPRTSTSMFSNVSLTRFVRTISTNAIKPDTTMLPNSTNKKIMGPTKAPTAPINFQSPAPSARANTSGNNNTSASTAPSTATLAPVQPDIAVRSVIPATIPGIVIKLGILRVRKSTKPATRVSVITNIQISSVASIYHRSWTLSQYFGRHAKDIKVVRFNQLAVLRLEAAALNAFPMELASVPMVVTAARS